MISNTAEISKNVSIGNNSNIWSYSQIREGATIGNNCIIGRNVYIDHNVKIGSNVKIQNNALIYYKTIIEDDVFVGPATCLTNDKYPRSTNNKGKIKNTKDWKAGTIVVKKGASIGANTIILTNVTIGSYALIGAGTVVTHSVPSFSVVTGNPGQIIGYICKLNHKIKLSKLTTSNNIYCQSCKKFYSVKYE